MNGSFHNFCSEKKCHINIIRQAWQKFFSFRKTFRFRGQLEQDNIS